MARKWYSFYSALSSILEGFCSWLRKNSSIKKYLIVFLLTIFLTTGVTPVLSQISTDNPRQLVQQAETDYRAGEFVSAVNYLEKAVELFEAQEDWQNLAITLTNLGRLQLSLGKPELALENWQKATTISEQRLSDRQGIIRNQIYQAEALQQMGFYHRACIMSLSALNLDANSCQDLTLQTLEAKTQLIPQQLNALQISGWRSFGNILRLLGNLEESELVLQAVAQSSSDTDPAATRLSLGNTLRARGDIIRDRQAPPKYDYIPWRCEIIEPISTNLPQKAQDFYQQAQQQYLQASTKSASENTRISAQLNLINLILETVQGDRSVPLPVRQSPSFRDQGNSATSGDRQQLATANQLLSQIDFTNLPINKATIYAQINFAKATACLAERTNNPTDWQKIRQILNQAYDNAKSIPDKSLESYVLGNLGGLYEYRGWWLDNVNSEFSNQEDNSYSLSPKSPPILTASRSYSQTVFNSSLVHFYPPFQGGIKGSVSSLSQPSQPSFDPPQPSFYNPSASLKNRETNKCLTSNFICSEKTLHSSVFVDSDESLETVFDIATARLLKTKKSSLLSFKGCGRISKRPKQYGDCYKSRIPLNQPSKAGLPIVFTPSLKRAKGEQNKLLSFSKHSLLGESSWYSLAEKSPNWCETAQDCSQEAIKLTSKALLLAKPIQTPQIAYQWQWQLGRLSSAQGDRKKAIALYQQATNTLESVREDLLTNDSDVQFSFRDSVEPLYRELIDLLLTTDDVVKYDYQGFPAEALKIVDFLRLSELENFLQCSLAPELQVETVVGEIDPQAVFIYPLILSDRLELIFKLPQQPIAHRATFIPHTEVEETVKQLQGYLRQSRFTQEVKQEAQKLYQWIIQPIEQDLENLRQKGKITTLVFVLDDSLRNIPLSVLYNEGEYLIEKYALAVIPNRQLFDPRPRQKQLKVLTAGVSEAQIVDGIEYEPLPYVSTEVADIQQLADTTNEPLLNQTFTEVKLEQQIDSATFPIVHIATHGEFSSNPEETYILVWGKRIKVKDFDRILQISNPDSSQIIELLILSACETAQGNRRAALGLAGVSAQARVRTTLASLWKVNDSATAEFMIKFYEELRDGATVAQAVRQTQLYFLSDRDWRRPYFWAPFVIVGNWL